MLRSKLNIVPKTKTYFSEVVSTRMSAMLLSKGIVITGPVKELSQLTQSNKIDKYLYHFI